jgi:hypothetical protein
MFRAQDEVTSCLRCRMKLIQTANSSPTVARTGEFALGLLSSIHALLSLFRISPLDDCVILLARDALMI